MCGWGETRQTTKDVTERESIVLVLLVVLVRETVLTPAN